MPTTVHAFAAEEAKGELKRFEYDLPDIGAGEVDIDVTHCGICHSDLSMLNNDWGMSAYPLVGGHEAAGTVRAVGEGVTNVKVGDRVGLGWFSGSCMRCRDCMGGDHNLCAESESTIVGRHGGFADVVRCKEAWAIKIPDGVDLAKAGPLFCGGITVFNPIVQFGVKPTDRVGVVGIGGLGHMALMFLKAWGCHVVAFSSNPAKTEEAKTLGAHEVVNSRDPEEFGKLARSLDFVLVTANVPLDWEAYLTTLKPKGRLHFVGAVMEPIAVQAFSMIMSQASVSGSPLGSPATTSDMLEFCARHDIAPVTETFAFDKINDAIQHLHDGKARYRIVLER
ncbi:MAG: NAD(P)-dependent alcohol dehydrogenase [Planctomycetota bacterium]